MPKRIRKSSDPNTVAFRVMKAATERHDETEPKPKPKTKNAAAAALGRRGGKVGGKVRASRMTPEERSEASRKAARARWDLLRTNSLLPPDDRNAPDASLDPVGGDSFMANALTDIVETLRSRLATLEAERAQIMALLATYGAADDVGPSPLGYYPVNGKPGLYVAAKFPPVPEKERVRLKRDHLGRSGLSPVIVRVALLHPGLDVTQLANRVMQYVTGDVPTRTNLRSMIKHLVDTGKLEKRGGEYFAVPKSQLDIEDKDSSG